MRTTRVPREIARSITANPVLPPGADETFTGYGVMGLPFASGHYLALREIPATSFAGGYRSVWHRDPAGAWRFFTTAPADLSCPRYFGAASEHAPTRCEIAVAWPTETSLRVSIDGVLDWRVEVGPTAGTRLMSSMGSLMPQWVWTSRPILAAMGRMAGPILKVGRVRLRGTVPNGQAFTVAPVLTWSVTSSTAVLDGVDLGAPGPLSEQAHLAGFWLPQRGILAAGHGHFEALDPVQHQLARAAVEGARPGA
ncbi:hypothetical protein [Tomitella biformata]|uniref:hypothetical protein n=1 Tax=Tomitella biformata TaxID=630403 RepID=UPI00046405D5|nr:hypothetical protein [Tomitella biformata]